MAHKNNQQQKKCNIQLNNGEKKEKHVMISRNVFSDHQNEKNQKKKKKKKTLTAEV
jgi:hypothetical protein